MPTLTTPDGTTMVLGLRKGRVIDVKDQDGQRRVRVEVTGFVSDSGWLYPRTVGGGGSERGAHLMPKVGSIVLVEFIGGDPNEGVYEGAWWAQGELPRDAQNAGAQAHEVQCAELSTSTAAVRITVDERSGHRAFRVYAVVKEEDGSETAVGALEIDIEKRVVGLYGLAAVIVKSEGLVQLDGLAINLDRRPVRKGTSAPV